MQVSYRWLTRMLGVELPLADLVDRLTMNGIEVEAVKDLGIQSGKVVTARILEMGPHPNADNLVLCRVDAGRPEPLRIVCGAKNMKPGDMVPLAVEGATLPNGITLKRSRIRGEVSEGMMCSPTELCWGEDASGLLILPEDWAYEVGKPFDAILDLKVTPNRPDCLSLLGIARDLAAALDAPPPAFPPCEVKEGTANAVAHASVRVEAPDGCPRYTGRVILGVRIGPSPLWLQRAVECAGMRPINNVVDVTNYILAELGHPLHAFDLDRVANHEVVIRHAREGEEVETLDGQKQKLVATDLLIADPEKPIALAGIMGCGNSEITEATTNVFLECAYFHPPGIRRTSKRLAKATESSYRFERGTESLGLAPVVDRAARLIAEVAGGEVCAGMFNEGPGVKPPAPIMLSVERCNMLSGLNLTAAEAAKPLRALGFKVEERKPGELSVTPPAIRPDVSLDVDLVEEITRITGYSKVPAVLPDIPGWAHEPAPEDTLSEILRDVFVQFGLSEAVNYSFLSADAIARAGFDPAEAVPLANPLSAEYALMRTDLLPGLLQTVCYNQNRGAADVALFEIGKVFRKDAASETGHAERWQFAVAIAGAADEKTWRGAARQSDFYDGKAIAEAVLERLGITGVLPERAADIPYLHPGKSGALKAGDTVLITAGELHPAVRAKLELKRNVVVVAGEFDALAPHLDNLSKCRDIPVFPGIARDLALVADRDMPAAQIEDVIAKRAKSLLAGMRLFDVYEGEKIPEGKRSLAYELRFSVPERTLTDEEVNQLQAKILADLKAKLGVELRS
jgi:phenylalanyl-tRNA synthetase beta chain